MQHSPSSLEPKDEAPEPQMEPERINTRSDVLRLVYEALVTEQSSYIWSGTWAATNSPTFCSIQF